MDRGSRRNGRTALFAAVLGLLLLPAGAGAAVTIGPSLSTPHTTTFSCGVVGGCTYSQGTPAYTSPMNGVVVRWAVRGGSGPLTLRVITGNTGGPASETRTPPSFDEESFPARLKIAMGDRIGVDLPNGFVSNIGVRQPTGPAIDSWGPALGNPETRPPTSSFIDRELLLNATIEADADADGFGDETQDSCPSSASTHQGPCPPTGRRKAALKKCKQKPTKKKRRLCRKKAKRLPI